MEEDEKIKQITKREQEAYAEELMIENEIEEMKEEKDVKHKRSN